MVQIPAWRKAVVTVGFTVFLKPSKRNSGLGPQVRPRVLPATPVAIHHSIVIHSFDTT